MTRARDQNRVRARREEQGLLLKELGQQVRRPDGRCIGAPLMSQVEGGFVPKRVTQVAIAAALSTTPEALWPEEYA